VAGVTPKAVANNASPDLVPLLMTRPRAASKTFVQGLPAKIKARILPCYSPLMVIKGLDFDLSLAPGDAVIFTSANGVLHGPIGQGQRAYCVGAATTCAASDNGWAAQMMGLTADALVHEMLRKPLEQRLFHLSGVHTRGNIASRLTAQGMHTENIAVYDQIAQSLTTEAVALILAGKPLLVPLFSPRSAVQFANQVPQAATVHVIALSAAVAQGIDSSAYAPVRVAQRPDAGAMLAEIASALDALSLG
jgi:uroporphyrinogen-III synthase